MSIIARRILPSEYGKYAEHLKRLDVHSKYLRFGVTMSDATIDELCIEFAANPEKHILFGIEDDQLEFIAIGHIALDDSMELAFSVLKDHQGKGLGSLLMRRCIQWCRTNNILKGCMVCLPSNSAIKHLCTKHGIRFHTECGETSAEVTLDSPGIDTYVNEGISSNIAAFDYTIKRLWSFAKIS